MAERGNRWLRCLDRWLGIPLTAAGGLFRRYHPVSSATPPRRVGFICLGAIGDILLLSALITALRRRLPQAHFALLTTTTNAAAARLIPGLNEHAAFSIRHIPAMVAWLRSRRLDILLDSTQWARLGALLSMASGADVTVGFDTAGQYRAASYTYKIVHRNDRHEVENFLALGSALYPNLTGKPQLLLPPCPPPELRTSSLYDDGILGEKSCVYLHMWPSGVYATLKKWPAAYWAALAGELVRQGYRVYLTGGTADTTHTNAFLRAFPGCLARSLAGQVSLEGMAWLFARAAAVVSVNTGTMHLASLAGAPTVGLHGPTNPLRWGPVGSHVRALLPRTGHCAYLNLGFEYPRQRTYCLDALPVDDVLHALHELHVL